MFSKDTCNFGGFITYRTDDLQDKSLQVNREFHYLLDLYSIFLIIVDHLFSETFRGG